MPQRLTVMISSTIYDLLDHRQAAEKACLERGMYPLMMEYTPAVDENVIQASLRMVDDCDIYLCIVGRRYGDVPAGYDKSVTQMEYERAVERGKKRLIYIMHEAHVPKPIRRPHRPQHRVQFEKFKGRLLAERFIKYFKSVDHLHIEIGNSLSRIVTEPTPGPPPPRPAPLLAVHPYPLQESTGFVGREGDMGHLNAWVSEPSAPAHQAHVLSIVGIGGEGKSSLVWKWFNDVAPEKMSPLAGRFWWSFYDEPDIKNFTVRAYSYVTGASVEQARELPDYDRETGLLDELRSRPFLFVLDGLERLLIGYAGDAPDADEPRAAADRRRPRKTLDPTAGIFLGKLPGCLHGAGASRFLITTRAYPADLEGKTGLPLEGCDSYQLAGLSDEDALALWRALGCSGSRGALLEMFNSFGNHALLIQALAAAVARHPPAPGDFDRWREDNPDFDPLSLDLRQRRTHVLEYIMRGLSAPALRVLRAVALFHAPASYDALAAILCGGGLLPGAEALHDALRDLAEQRLLGWDKTANRFDLHPLVRLHVRGGMDADALREAFAARLPYFRERPAPRARRDVNGREDLHDAIELYRTHVGLRDYNEAARVFIKRLSRAMLYRLSLSCYGVMLLKLLFPGGLKEPPSVTDPALQAKMYNFLATAYYMSGRLEKAAGLYGCQIGVGRREGARQEVYRGWRGRAEVLRLTGDLREAEAAARQALAIARQEPFQRASALRVLGGILTARGCYEEARQHLELALPMFRALNQPQSEGLVCASMSHLELLSGRPEEALALAGRALELADNKNRFERDFIRAIRLQGEAQLALGEAAAAEERLRFALRRARAVNWVREEIPLLAGLAELARRRGDFDAAREWLEAAWPAARRGPYRLSHAHALNILAQVERDAGEKEAAAAAARQAYELAFCDGPPFAYQRGLQAAAAHLAALGLPEPTLRPPDKPGLAQTPDEYRGPPADAGDWADDDDEGLE